MHLDFKFYLTFASLKERKKLSIIEAISLQLKKTKYLNTYKNNIDFELKNVGENKRS